MTAVESLGNALMTDSPSPKKRGCLSRLLLLGAFAFLALVVFIVVGLLVAEGKGKAAWAAYKAKWEPSGESFDWRATIPPAIPDPLNFVKHPVFDDALALSNGLDPESLPNSRGRGKRESFWEAQSVHLESWFQKSARPDTDAEAIALFKQFFAERERQFALLAEAARRPSCRFDLDYEGGGIFSGSTSDAMHICRDASILLQLRGVIALREERVNDARVDWETIEHLSRHLDQGPGLIHGLVSLSCSQIGMQLLWEGLRTQQWAEFQLERFEEILAKRDYHRSTLRHFREERGGFIFLLEESLINRGALPKVFLNASSDFGAMEHMPKGWLYRNLVSYCDLMQRFLLAPDGLPIQRIDYRRLAGMESALLERRLLFNVIPNPHHLFVVITMPMFESTVSVMMRAQAANDMARIAIANERFRIESEAYAADLGALELDPMPVDSISGEPYRYRVTEGGRPILYGIGSNGKDDGGEIGENWRQGDWVWQYENPSLAADGE